MVTNYLYLRKLSVLSVLFTGLLMASCSKGESNHKKESEKNVAIAIENLDKKYRKGLLNENQSKKLKQEYLGWKLVYGCKANLLDAKSNDVVLALSDSAYMKSVVLAMIKSGNNIRDIIIDKNKSNDNYEYDDDIGFLSKTEIQCLTPDQANERNKDIKESEGIHGHINVPIDKDIVCFSSKSTGPSFKCLAYSEKKSIFYLVGGWAL